MRFRRSANLHYKGQLYELNVAAPPSPAGGALDRAWLDQLAEAFGEEHERTYGHRAGPEEPVELVNMVLVAEGLPDAPVVPDTLHLDRSDDGAGGGSRNAYFGPEEGWLETPVVGRSDLAGGGWARSSSPTGMPGWCFDVRIVSDVLTLATLGAGVRCVVRIS